MQSTIFGTTGSGTELNEGGVPSREQRLRHTMYELIFKYLAYHHLEKNSEQRAGVPI